MHSRSRVVELGLGSHIKKTLHQVIRRFKLPGCAPLCTLSQCLQVILIVFAILSTFVGTAGLSIIANGVAYALGEARFRERPCNHVVYLPVLWGECTTKPCSTITVFYFLGVAYVLARRCFCLYNQVCAEQLRFPLSILIFVALPNDRLSQHECIRVMLRAV